MIDETYTASSLLGLAHHHTGGAEAAEAAEALYVPSSTVCKNIYAEVFPSESSGRDPLGPECSSPVSSKRVRRSGKYSQQERDRIRCVRLRLPLTQLHLTPVCLLYRRERNRMHAKKTRDRKKQFLEISEKVISEMEAEALAMRHYLRSLNLISEQEMAEYIERDNRSKRAIEQMKLVRPCRPLRLRRPRRSDRVALSRALLRNRRALRTTTRTTTRRTTTSAFPPSPSSARVSLRTKSRGRSRAATTTRRPPPAATSPPTARRRA